MKIDFSSYNHVTYAFGSLLAIFQQDMAKVSSDKFTAIKVSCEARASAPLRDLIKCAPNIDHLLKTFFDNNCCNWMDVRFLKVIAIACGNKKLESLINDYTRFIYSTRLCDVWSSALYHSVRDEYHDKLEATFGDEDPGNLTIEGLIRSIG